MPQRLEARRASSLYSSTVVDAVHRVSQNRCEVCKAEQVSRSLSDTSVLKICPVCDHIVRDPELSGASARTHAWGGHAGMDKIRLALTWRRMSRHLSRLHASKRRPLDVLELGYGRGVLLEKVIRAQHNASGVERHLLSTDTKKPEVPNATLYDATAEECTLARDSYDFIFAIHVVEHLIDPAAVFRKIAASLRHGGVFYCVTPNAQSYGLSLFRQHWWNLEDPTHYRFFSRRSLESALSHAGFQQVRTAIVREDSMTLEISSALRALSSGDETHGILHHPWARATGFALTPFALFARLLVPGLSPSIEAIAVKT